MEPLRTHLAILASAAMLCSGTLANAQHACQERHQGHHGLDLRQSGNADRSDTLDILHTRIALDLTQVSNGQIAAATTVRLTPRMPGVDKARFDLLALTVDSVIRAGTNLVFTHVSEDLDIALGGTYGIGDTLEITIHYHGDPVVDASGWGGFYTSGSVLYNLGVAFDSQPHSFGRAWFPCFDNFVERSTFEFIVRTDANRHAWCTGELLSETDLGGGQFQSHWRLDRTIPSYLASVTASTYVAVRDTFPSISGVNCPVDLVAQPTDTTGMKASFIHLPEAFASFEGWFGPHQWPRVGYCLTPQGAMEHPTNISYTASIANGSLTNEATMAHELGHHWFGDQTTCARAEEMYLNEGFAEYLSYLFLEQVYGRERYLETVRENHHEMVWNSHLQDEGWWALADMPQDHTYGAITYNKGADVLHTLRSYLGDSLFRVGLTSFLDVHAFRPVSTAMLRDHLTAVTGIDMDDYFTDWILQPGWAAFEVDSFATSGVVLPGGLHETTVFIQQKQRGPAAPYHNVPMSVTFVDALGTRWDHPAPVMLGPGTSAIVAAPPFQPVNVMLNTDDRISQAVTVHDDTLTATGIDDLDLVDLRLTVTALPNPVPVRIEEYWVAADTYTEEPNLYRVSPDRWWRIDLNAPSGTAMTGRIRYDGRSSMAGGLDVQLMQDTAGVTFHEDSLLLLFRPNAHFPWSVYPDHTISTIGSATDKTGRMELGHVEPGDYTMGFRYSATSLPEHRTEPHWTLAPNPATSATYVTADRRPWASTMILVHDLRGQLIRTLPSTGKRTLLPVDGLATGTYIISTSNGPQQQFVGRLQVLGGQ